MKNLFPFFAFLLVLVASSFTLSTSRVVLPAHVDYFLKLDGIDGESTAQGHEKWIELESCSIYGEGKKVNIAFVKTSNGSSPFAEAAASGRKFKKAFLHVRKAGGTYLKYELENVLISNYSISGAGSDRPMESLSINFTKIVYL